MTVWLWIAAGLGIYLAFCFLVALVHELAKVAWPAVRFYIFGLRLRLAIRLLPANLRDPSILFWTEKLNEQAQLALWASEVEAHRAAIEEYQERARQGAVNN